MTDAPTASPRPRQDAQAPALRMSRSKVDLFVECARCFFLDVRLGVKRPPSFPFTLNQAVDSLLKRDFDVYRARGEPHPLFVQHGLQAKPFDHPDLHAWRTSRTRGLSYTHPTLAITCFGLVDDVWIDAQQKLIKWAVKPGGSAPGCKAHGPPGPLTSVFAAARYTFSLPPKALLHTKRRNS